MRTSRRKNRPDIDLALVAGLKIFIRQLAGFKSLNMLFGDLKIIEEYEKGARRRAIRHIRETVEPRALGLRLAHPKPRGTDPGRILAKEPEHMARAQRSESDPFPRQGSLKSETKCASRRA